MSRPFRWGSIALVVVAALGGCSISGSDDPAPPPTTAGVTLELRDLGDGLAASVPVGWTAPDPAYPRVFRPPESGGPDRDVTLWWIDVSCGGPCTPRDDAAWERVVRSTALAQFADADAFVTRQERPLVDGVLIEAENNFGVIALTVARWAGGASEYLICRGSASSEDAALLRELEAACLAITPPAPG